MAGFPVARPRRLRQSEALRSLVRETTLSPRDFIYPLFVVPGRGVKREITSMPGNYHLSPDMLPAEADLLGELRIPGVILFGLPEAKDTVGSGAYDDGGVVQRAVRTLKETNPHLLVMTDVCLCEYTSHGHCGVLDGDKVDNDSTLELLTRTAVSHVAAGADVVAPSDMMDGRVGAIREAWTARASRTCR